jgi:class 3 adenylate cyclase
MDQAEAHLAPDRDARIRSFTMTELDASPTPGDVATERRTTGAPILAWSLAGLALAFIATTIVLVHLNRDSIHNIDDANLLEIVLPFGWAFVAGLVASRLPSNPLGWVLLAIALSNAIPGVALQYTRYALVTHPGAPFSAWIPWFGFLTDNLVYPAGLAAPAFLILPTGRFLSDRWRMVAWAGAAFTAALLIVTLTDPNLISDRFSVGVANPTGVPAFTGLQYGPFGYAIFLGGLGVLALAGASVLVRLRRATGDERLQLKWVAYAAGITVLANVLATVVALAFLPPSVTDLVGTLIAIFGFGVAIPTAFAVAILRYRLYDLDLLLNRTLVYGTVTVMLAAGVGIADILGQRVVEAVFHQRSDFVSAGIGACAALALGPLRRWVRRIVDRFLPARARLTLLFTDIVGSTQAIVDLGDERWRELLDRYRVAVRHELSRFRGREINTAGDAFFATFSRPASAVECARAIGESVKGLGLRVRTGLHVGDVEMRGEQVSGLAVHAAARVMAEAGQDQILISSELAEVLAGRWPLSDAGRHALKGVPGEWHLFAVGSPGRARI